MFLRKGQRVFVKTLEEVSRTEGIFKESDGSFISPEGVHFNKQMSKIKSFIVEKSINDSKIMAKGWFWEEWMLNINNQNNFEVE